MGPKMQAFCPWIDMLKGKRTVSGQSGFWKFAGLPDRTWCPVEPYRTVRQNSDLVQIFHSITAILMCCIVIGSKICRRSDFRRAQLKPRLVTLLCRLMCKIVDKFFWEHWSTSFQDFWPITMHSCWSKYWPGPFNYFQKI